MKVLAYAKLNLALRVLGRRPDGFHEIDSLVQTIDLADTIAVEKTDAGLEFESDLGLPLEEDLAGQAAALLLTEKGRRHGIRVAVKKGIPLGAGLGGGSSDAAAVLWAADRLLPPPLPAERLAALAERLGADVPLFLTGGRVWISGKGERVVPVSAPRAEHFLVLVPPVRSHTAEVYARFDHLRSAPPSHAATLDLGANDLEEAALHLYPALSPYRRAIETLGGRYCGMSGSGSAFYAAFFGKDAAEVARERLTPSFPEARIYVCAPTDCGHRVEEGVDADRD